MSHPWPIPQRPFAIRAINGVGKALSSIGITRPVINSDAIIKEAQKRTGLTEAGPLSFQQGLEKLVDSINHEAALTQIGRVAAKNSLVNAMVSRLQIIDYVNKHPEVREEKIEQPIFILGLPRTGTTILHAVVAEDPNNRAPLMWEMSAPYPPPTANRAAHESTIVEQEKQAAQLDLLTPGFKAIHETNPRLAEECISMMASAFFQEQYSTVSHLPSYRQWYMSADATPCYEWHKLFLQYLQHSYGVKRWTLKSPMHLPFLTTILKIYPDACIVQTHREPTKVLGSVSSLICTLRSGFSDNIDAHRTGREEADFFADILARGMAQREGINQPAQFYDFQFDDIINRPIDAVADMYQHFDLNLSDSARKLMQSYLDNRPRTKHGKHSYTLETFGLDESKDGALFTNYRDQLVRSVL